MQAVHSTKYNQPRSPKRRKERGVPHEVRLAEVSQSSRRCKVGMCSLFAGYIGSRRSVGLRHDQTAFRIGGEWC